MLQTLAHLLDQRVFLSRGLSFLNTLKVVVTHDLLFLLLLLRQLIHALIVLRVALSLQILRVDTLFLHLLLVHDQVINTLLHEGNVLLLIFNVLVGLERSLFVLALAGGESGK